MQINIYNKGIKRKPFEILKYMYILIEMLNF